MAIVFPSVSDTRQLLVKAIKKSGIKQVEFEGPFIVCKVHDSKIALDLVNIVGRDVALARQVSRRFFDVMGAIVQAGTNAILPGEKFYVKAILTAKADYVERDIEFASEGMLVEKLAKTNVLPARNELEAERVILAIIGKKRAYVCVR